MNISMNIDEYQYDDYIKSKYNECIMEICSMVFIHFQIYIGMEIYRTFFYRELK